MRASGSWLTIILLAGLTVACSAPEDRESLDQASTSPAELHLADLRSTVVTLHDKFSALAEAMPEGDLAWRPMDGVRSVSEVYIHIAADNYYVPSLMGWRAPDETGVTDDVATFRAYQDRTMSRDQMLTALDDSFRFFLASMEESVGALDREVVLGSPTTVGDVWIRAVVHMHEHLGQSIAYARANSVVPPWSA